MQKLVTYLEEANARLLTSPLTRDQVKKVREYYREYEKVAAELATTSEADTAATLTLKYQQLKAELDARMDTPSLEQQEAARLLSQQDRTIKLLNRLLDALDTERNAVAIRGQLLVLTKQMDQLERIDSLLMQQPSGYQQAASEQYTNTVVRYSAVTSAAMTRMEEQGRESFINSDMPTISKTNIRLPPLNVPKFTGKIQEWQSFKDLFNLLITEQAVVPSNRLAYLHSYLEGPAKAVITHIHHNTENAFEQAWNALLKVYENRRAVIFKSLGELLLKAPKAVSEKQLKANYQDFLREVETLRSQNVRTEDSNEILVFLLLTRLDSGTRRDFETSQKDAKEVPELEELKAFIERRLNAIEQIAAPQASPSTSRALTVQKYKPSAGQQSPLEGQDKSHGKNCPICKKEGHKIFRCPVFISDKWSAEMRTKSCRELNLCMNCLSAGHRALDCPSKYTCKVCNKKHNSLLHYDQRKVNMQSTEEGALLATALVVAGNLQTGKEMYAKVLIDQGSQVILIRRSLCQELGLELRTRRTIITGVGDKVNTTSNKITEVRITPRFGKKNKNPPELQVEAIVLDSIMEVDPATGGRKFFPGNMCWADPTEGRGQIDILLGADMYPDLIKAGLKKANKMVAQNTIFGYILAGMAPTARYKSCAVSVVPTSKESVEDSIRRLFEETPENVDHHDLNEFEKMETLYKATTKRHQDGRYEVRFPFVGDPLPPALGNSDKRAKARLENVLKRIDKDPDLKAEYEKFMDEYLEAGHMSEFQYTGEYSVQDLNYLPHHPVFKHESTTTKTRVVFDASAKTSIGLSLNDILMNEPKLQDDLPQILARFRIRKYCYCAVAEKIFRQILIAPDQRKYQTILWRKDGEIKIFVLNTVTYGTKSATYLSVRTVLQLAEDERADFPEMSRIVKEEFYVDDHLGGADTIEEARRQIRRLRAFFQRGGFNLRKFIANEPEVLQDLDSSLIEKSRKAIGTDETTKTLGLIYDGSHDEFAFRFKDEPMGILTKRSLLSRIARIYDPLNLLLLVITTMRAMVQELWRIECDWDDEVPTAHAKVFNKFINELQKVALYTVPRWAGIEPGADVELHGFADASGKAIAACLYIRVKTLDGPIKVTLLMAKGRLTPMGPREPKELDENRGPEKRRSNPTIAKLELCAALMLAELAKPVLTMLSLPANKVRYWSDSTATIAWIATNPLRLKPYMAARTTKIRSISSFEQWNHVKGAENPADIASRGTTPQKLKDSLLWWEGPTWLHEEKGTWPSEGEMEPLSAEEIGMYQDGLKAAYVTAPEETTSPIPEGADEEVVVKTAVVTKRDGFLLTYLAQFSCFMRAMRLTAYLMRFFNNVKEGRRRAGVKPALLSVHEILLVIRQYLKASQALLWQDEIKQLRKGKELPPSSKLRPLGAWLDANGILRLGGRLKRAMVQMSKELPALLPRGCHMSRLIMREAHLKTMHGGATLTLAQSRSEYWIVRGKSVANSVIKNCVKCSRYGRKPAYAMMGDYPDCRVIESRPFTHTGVDYAGPIWIKYSPGRNAKRCKAYIAIFVCMATKAVHLELVSDLTAEAFLAAFSRFAALRGMPLVMYSDNGTNFVKANKILDKNFRDAMKELLAEPESEEPRTRNEKDAVYKKTIAEEMTKKGVVWKFNPPYAPHMGGLWEAGVKSTKHHLNRTVGNALLTYEELSTVLHKISACLNSRPLTPMSEDPDDLEVITPGHFLVGSPLLQAPQPCLLDENISTMRRWKRTQRMMQEWWKKWRTEYLSRLQNRPKWMGEGKNLKVGQLVLIMDDQQGPGEWAMGRITDVHPGADGRVRVVDLRTKNKEGVRRAITKLCPLPDENDEETKRVFVNALTIRRAPIGTPWYIATPQARAQSRPKGTIYPAGYSDEEKVEEIPEMIPQQRKRRNKRPTPIPNYRPRRWNGNSAWMMAIILGLLACLALGEPTENDQTTRKCEEMWCKAVNNYNGNNAVIGDRGRIIIKGHEECELRLNDEIVRWNKNMSEVPGIWFGTVRYNCSGIEGFVHSRMECLDVLYSSIDDRIIGCEHTYIKVVLGILAGSFVGILLIRLRAFLFQRRHAQVIWTGLEEVGFLLRQIVVRRNDDAVRESIQMQTLEEYGSTEAETEIPTRDYEVPRPLGTLPQPAYDVPRTRNVSQGENNIPMRRLLPTPPTELAQVHEARAQLPYRPGIQLAHEAFRARRQKKPRRNTGPAPTVRRSLDLDEIEVPERSSRTDWTYMDMQSGMITLLILPLLIGSALGGDATLYISNEGKVCTDQQCTSIHTTLTSLAWGSTIEFIDYNGTRLEATLDKINQVDLFKLVYITSDFYIEATSVWECELGSDTCHHGSCNRFSTHMAGTLDVALPNLTNKVGYGCGIDPMRCTDTRCFLSNACVHYKWRVTEKGALGYVYQRMENYWEATIRIVHGNYTRNIVLSPKERASMLHAENWAVRLPVVAVAPILSSVAIPEFVLRYMGKKYFTEASQLQFPVKGTIGEYQMSIQGDGRDFDETEINCPTYDCKAHCFTSESAMSRFHRTIEYARKPMQAIQIGNVMRTETPLVGSISLLFASEGIKGLKFDKASCELQQINSYACTGCSEIGYVTLAARAILVRGIMPFYSNCSFGANYTPCQETAYMLPLGEVHSHCLLTFPTTNTSMILTIDAIFKGNLIPRQLEASIFTEVKHVGTSWEFMLGSAGAAFTVYALTNVKKFLKCLFC